MFGNRYFPGMYFPDAWYPPGSVVTPSPEPPIPATGAGGRTGIAILPKFSDSDDNKPIRRKRSNKKRDIEIAAALLLLDW